MLRPLLHRFALFSATALLCLHTFTPHCHAAGALSFQSTPARGLFGVLRTVVSADVGTDHLEHFSVEEALTAPANKAPAILPDTRDSTFAPYTAVALPAAKATPPPFRGPPPPSPVYLLADPLRGPPART